MSGEIFAFVLAAAALLGSPGPGIAALVAVGRAFDRRSALKFFGALQIGLAIAAGISVAGLAGIFQASPTLRTVLTVVATVYLLWLAWTIAAAPVAGATIGDRDSNRLTSRGAFLLGVANPKAYLAFASLMGSFTLAPRVALADGLLKWAICVAVMIVVDFAWLALGAAFGRIEMTPAAERAFNIAMGGTILAACAAAWV